MNFGTPQEVLEEHREFNESIGEKPLSESSIDGYIFYLMYVIVMVLFSIPIILLGILN